MPNVEPSFVLYALLLEPGGCLRAHITLFELVEPEEKKKDVWVSNDRLTAVGLVLQARASAKLAVVLNMGWC